MTCNTKSEVKSATEIDHEDSMLDFKNENSSMQGFSTQRIGQRWHDDDRSFWKSSTFSKIPGFGYGSTNCAIQYSGKELLLV